MWLCADEQMPELEETCEDSRVHIYPAIFKPRLPAPLAVFVIIVELLSIKSSNMRRGLCQFSAISLELSIPN